LHRQKHKDAIALFMERTLGIEDDLLTPDGGDRLRHILQS